MNHLLLTTTSPYFNLAAEEYLLECAAGDYFMLWQNEKSVIIGCHQNAYAEVDIAEAARRGIVVARRRTGGGAVYHDLGNVNFSLIRDLLPMEPENPYEMLCSPIVETLRQCGVGARLGGRNDLLVGGRKVAGCAVRRQGRRVLAHGAMLYNTDLECLASLLTPHCSKFEDKAVKSVSSRVANVSGLLERDVALPDFMRLWADNAIGIFGGRQSILDDEQAAEIERMAFRYADKEWIYGKVMPYALRRVGRTAAGSVEVQLEFYVDRISRVGIYGDFFGCGDIAELERGIVGCEYDLAAVRERLGAIDLQRYINGIMLEELVELFF